MATVNLWICCARSNVVVRIKAWQVFILVSTICTAEIQSEVVLPVAEGAPAMISLPLLILSASQAKCSVLGDAIFALTLYHCHDGVLLDSRWALKTILVNFMEELAIEIHALE